MSQKNIFLLIAVLIVLLGMFISESSAEVSFRNLNDPMENFNRKIYGLNNFLDQEVLIPATKIYNFFTPKLVRNCIHNVFCNSGDVWTAANYMLQGQGIEAINTVGRFMLNSTMGIGGCIDIATLNGGMVFRKTNDFGITLKKWGVKQGPYLVLPIKGPSTLRDFIGDFVDLFWNPIGIKKIRGKLIRDSLYGLYIIEARSELLDAKNTLDWAFVDSYSFVRDQYLHKRSHFPISNLGSNESYLLLSNNYDE